MLIRIKLAALALLAALQVRCSVVFKDAPEICKTTADCAAKRPDLNLVCSQGLCLADDQVIDPFEKEWGCTDLPARVVDPTLKHTVRILAVGAIDRMPISGVNVRLCNGLDVGCQFDANDPRSSQVSDAQGATQFEVADGFSGFLLYEKKDFISSIVMLQDINAAQIQRQAELNMRIGGIGVFKPGDLELLVSLVSGGTYNSSEAVIAFTVENCQRQPAGGTRGLLDRLGANTQEFYFAGSLPSATAAATDASGEGGFVNVPPGVSTLSVRILGSTEDLGKMTLVTRPGHFTAAEFTPGRRPDVQVE